MADITDHDLRECTCLSNYVPGYASTLSELDALSNQGVTWVAYPSRNGRKTYLGATLLFPADFSLPKMIEGYSKGCFPYPDQTLPPVQLDDPTNHCWHRPAVRTLFITSQPIPKELRRSLKKYPVVVNENFEQCIRACATASRKPHSSKAWINEALIKAYVALHEQGNAFCIQVKDPTTGRIIGGMTGINIGGLLTIEAMYHDEQGGTSKPAVAALMYMAKASGIPCIDAQLPTLHFDRWGAAETSNTEYIEHLPTIVSMAPPDWKRWEANPPA
jgi:leucyl/phenylalanyl-tRNA--protein transferase